MSTATERVTVDRVEGNVTDLAPTQQNQAMIEVASTRAAQEVQAAMAIAKRFPRDQFAAEQRIVTACKRRSLADQAIYSFPRGNTTVEGPSIRLAEVLAQSWGNIESGVIELERRNGESTAMTYCWDLETNTRDVKVFQVRHIRDTKKGPQKLTDERDIYEMIANTGARRKRACIIAVIPGDVVDNAVAECNKTMQGNNGTPIADRVKAMVAAFAEHSVTIEMIEKRLRHKLDAISEAELAGLRKIFQSLKDGMTQREQWFDLGPAQRKPADLGEALDNKAKPEEPKQPEPTTPTITSYNELRSALEDHCQANGIEEETMNKFLAGKVLAAGTKGKESTIKAETCQQWYAEFTGKK